MTKKLFLFLAIATVLGVGILVLQPYGQESSPLQEQDTETQETVQEFAQPTQQTIQAIILQILGSQFSATTATHQTTNLDTAGGYELIIGAVEQGTPLSARPVQATIQVVTLTGEQNQYERVGSVQYQELMRGTPEVKKLQDVTGDGKPEIIASLQYGGASSWAEGVLQVDVANKKVNWLKIQNAQGQQQDAIFLLAGSLGHWNSVQFQDVTGDNRPELIELFAQRLPFEDQQIVCEANVYIWTGNQFGYAAELSEQILSSLSSNCEL